MSRLNLFLSSQSVARVNTLWSNDIVRGGPRRSAKDSSGFAGRDDLEQTRRYRGEENTRRSAHGSGYRMVFDVPSDHGRGSEKKRKRSRSRERDEDVEGRRKRSTSPRLASKGRDRDHDRDRHRNENHGHRVRSGSHDRGSEHRYGFSERR